MNTETLDLHFSAVPAFVGHRRRRVILESPYAGDIERNLRYARAALKDSLMRHETPIASHLLYTQPGVLNDDNPAERRLGIEAGLEWRHVADLAVFYTDLGWSAGMVAARDVYAREGKPVTFRAIGFDWQHNRAFG